MSELGGLISLRLKPLDENFGGYFNDPSDSVVAAVPFIVYFEEWQQNRCSPVCLYDFRLQTFQKICYSALTLAAS